MQVSFFVPGVPQPGGSKKAFVIPGTNRASVVEDARRNRPWRDRVASVALEHHGGELLGGPLALRVVFYMPRPRGHFGSGRNADTVKPSAPPYPAKKPDTTKLLRALEDALTCVIWKDDAQVVDQHASKRWGERPGALVEVRTMEGTPA